MNTTIAAYAVASQCWLFSVGKRKKTIMNTTQKRAALQREQKKNRYYPCSYNYHVYAHIHTHSQARRTACAEKNENKKHRKHRYMSLLSYARTHTYTTHLLAGGAVLALLRLGGVLRLDGHVVRFEVLVHSREEEEQRKAAGSTKSAERKGLERVCDTGGQRTRASDSLSCRHAGCCPPRERREQRCTHAGAPGGDGSTGGEHTACLASTRARMSACFSVSAARTGAVRRCRHDARERRARPDGHARTSTAHAEHQSWAECGAR